MRTCGVGRTRLAVGGEKKFSFCLDPFRLSTRTALFSSKRLTTRIYAGSSPPNRLTADQDFRCRCDSLASSGTQRKRLFMNRCVNSLLFISASSSSTRQMNDLVPVDFDHRRRSVFTASSSRCNSDDVYRAMPKCSVRRRNEEKEVSE